MSLRSGLAACALAGAVACGWTATQKARTVDAAQVLCCTIEVGTTGRKTEVCGRAADLARALLERRARAKAEEQP